MAEKQFDLPVSVPLFSHLFVFADPGRDQDDEDVLVSLNLMIRKEILSVLGVVANLAPSQKRARLAKGTLDILGQGNIPVGVGSNCLQPEDDGLEYQFHVSYLADEKDVVPDGAKLIYDTLNQAKPKSVVLLLISGMTDAATVLREHTRLFSNAVRRVVIMGGVATADGVPSLDEEGRLIPDLTAQNNAFDKESAKFLYRQLQDLGIPITTVSRHAAIACKVPRSVYDDMAATGHPVGERLLSAQKKAIEELFNRACLPAGDPKRFGLPDRCDKTWFCNTFCGGKGSDRQAGSSIWDLIETFNLYDPCTLIACIPNLREHFFAPSVSEVFGVEHLVIGVSAAAHNVRDGKALAEFMRNMLVSSLRASPVLVECPRRATVGTADNSTEKASAPALVKIA